MASINKVDAFIMVAEAVLNGENSRVVRMKTVIDRAIDKELKEKTYSSKFTLRRDEKKIFNK